MTILKIDQKHLGHFKVIEMAANRANLDSINSLRATSPDDRPRETGVSN